MQSIITRYYGPTNTKPACIRAWTSGNPKKRYTFSRETHDHIQAAKALAAKLAWCGTWAEGSLGNDMDVFVNVSAKGISSGNTFQIVEG